MGRLAQLVRAPALQAGCRGFESLAAHQTYPDPNQQEHTARFLSSPPTALPVLQHTNSGRICENSVMTPTMESTPPLDRGHRNPASVVWKSWAVWAVLALFAICGVVHYWNADGDDLSSSYVGCRLMATGNASHLYSYDPQDFAAVGPDPAWQAAADAAGYDAFLHPYVQTPLWAYALRPVCGARFAFFEHFFDVLTMLSFAACLLLVARNWAPVLWSPYAMAAVVLCLWFSEPFRYAMSLMQTHVLFLAADAGQPDPGAARKAGLGFDLRRAAAGLCSCGQDHSRLSGAVLGPNRTLEGCFQHDPGKPCADWLGLADDRP